jgi:[histone H4]-lysine20 N-methyltransferase SETD8
LFLFKVKTIPGKGRGVFATKVFKPGNFIVEYKGEILNQKEHKLKQQQYNEAHVAGSYVFEYRYRERMWL